jgi:hypothetical protein
MKQKRLVNRKGKMQRQKQKLSEEDEHGPANLQRSFFVLLLQTLFQVKQ